jgi:hypothetical protein
MAFATAARTLSRPQKHLTWAAGLRPSARPLRFATMRDLETIDSELRLLAAVRRVCREQDGLPPAIGPVDELTAE